MANIANWGMGVNVSDTGEVTNYGFPESLDPTNFHPDMEVCTIEEIYNHKKALKDWADKEKNNTKLNTGACSCAPDQGGPCSACMEAKYNL